MGWIYTACTIPSALSWNILDDVDPKSAKVARERYGCLTPWQSDPATYGHAALTGFASQPDPTCEADVAHALNDLFKNTKPTPFMMVSVSSTRSRMHDW